jgi:hypothetical protein
MLGASQLKAKRVTAGRQHTCVISLEGRVYCFGSNAYGQLGNGLMGGYSATPRLVSLPSPAVHLAAGDFHTCASLQNKAIYCWGRNNRGQLVIGTLTHPLIFAQRNHVITYSYVDMPIQSRVVLRLWSGLPEQRPKPGAPETGLGSGIAGQRRNAGTELRDFSC